MPLYVVRWPNLSAALVRAAHEEQLLDILDEEGNPNGCRWAVYDGPLFIDIELAASIHVDEADDEPDETGMPLDPARIQLVGVDDLAARKVSVARIRDAGETGDEMIHEICRFAFPATAAAMWDGESYEIDPADLERALREDAMLYVQDTWRHSQLHRSTDPVDQLALAMDASPDWVRSTVARAPMDDDDDLDDLDDLDDEADDEELDDEMTLDEAISKLLQGATELWTHHGDADTVRKVLTGVMELLDAFERDDLP